MVSDNATIFTSEEFSKFCKEAGILQKFIAPGHPAINGLAERNVQTLKRRLSAMSNQPLSMRKKIREIRFRYQATPLGNEKTPAKQYLQRQIRIELYALKPTKFQTSKVPTNKARQLSVGERVLARFYSNNKRQWRLGTIVKKFGQLHYLVELEDGYVFKRHIDQLHSTGIQPKKSVHFAPETLYEPEAIPDVQEPSIGDLVTFPTDQEKHDDHQVDNKVPVAEKTECRNGPVRRSERSRRPPTYLRNYITKF